MFCVVTGDVRVTVIPPWDRSLLYAGHMPGMPNNYSPVNFFRPDPKKHDIFRSATPFDLTLYSGDCMYLPAYWWHQTESSADEATIFVKFWYTVSSEWLKLLFTGLEDNYI